MNTLDPVLVYFHHPAVPSKKNNREVMKKIGGKGKDDSAARRRQNTTQQTLSALRQTRAADLKSGGPRYPLVPDHRSESMRSGKSLDSIRSAAYGWVVDGRQMTASVAQGSLSKPCGSSTCFIVVGWVGQRNGNGTGYNSSPAPHGWLPPGHQPTLPEVMRGEEALAIVTIRRATRSATARTLPMDAEGRFKSVDTTEPPL